MTDAQPPIEPPLIDLRGITEEHFGVPAIKGVDFSVMAGKSMRCSARTGPANQR